MLVSRSQSGTPASSRRGHLPTVKRSWGTVTAGVLMIVIGGLIGGLAFIQAGQTESVLAVRDSVAEGQTIDRSNLVSKQVAGLDHAVPVDQADKLAGQTASIDLPAGHVVTSDAASSAPIPGGGQAVVGIAVTAAQMPGAELEIGDTVRVVEVPAGEDSAAVDDDAATVTEQARVLDVTPPAEGTDKTVVTVVAADGAADQLAAGSAAERLAVVTIPADTGQ